jgi:hypothetical protein
VHPRRIASLLPALLLLLAAAACGGRPAYSATPGGMAPGEVVERFLRAASQKQYGAMAELFGTPEGSVLQRDPRPDAERRMYAIASVLEHERFTLRDQSPVPGSATREMGITVQLVNRGRTVEVPFTAVPGPNGRWFVEKVDLERITSLR